MEWARMLANVGKKVWAIAEGSIPAGRYGRQPQVMGREAACILNAGDREAHVEITVYFGDREPIGPHRLTIGARRAKDVRFKELIDPWATPPDSEYSVVVTSSVPIVVQLSRRDTGDVARDCLGTMAF